MKRLIFLSYIFIFTFSVYSIDLFSQIKGITVEHSEILNQSNYKIDFLQMFVKDCENKCLNGKRSMFFLKAKEWDSEAIYKEITSFLIQNKFDLVVHKEGLLCGEDFQKRFYKSNPFLEDYAYNNSAPFVQGDESDQYFLYAKKKEKEKISNIFVYINKGWWTYPIIKLDVVETENRKR